MMNNTAEDIQDRMLSHVLKHHFSAIADSELESRLSQINKEIDSAGRKKKRHSAFVVCFASAAAVAVLLLVGGLGFRAARIPALEYYNYGESAMNVYLPDGTQVWMNPGARLSLDGKFNRECRDVTLEGEAYFDVTRDEQRPFTVRTDGFRVRVLGTVFNVRALSDGDSEVTLAKGSVMMQSPEGMNLVRLIPGQQAVLDAETRALEIRQTAVGDMLMRHYGAVSLDHATIEEILSVINSSYGSSVECSKPSDTQTYNFSFQKDSPLEDVLSMLRFVCPGQEFVIR